MEITYLFKNTVVITVITMALTSLHVHAQEAGFSAHVATRLLYDDNILRTSDANAQSDASLVVAPQLSVAGILGKQHFSITYKGQYAKYFDNGEVDYTDHDISLEGAFDHSNRLTSDFDVQYKNKHEDFGDLNTIFDGLTAFNRYTEKQINGKVAYGRQDSIGQIILRLGRNNRDYKNNNQEYRSFKRDLTSLAFYYRIAPRTRLLTEVVYQDYSYHPKVDFIDLDNEYIRYQAGIEWALTNQLEGIVKVGYQDRNYRLDTLRDIDGLSYEVDVTWKPNTYTKIGMAAKQESIDSSLESAGGFLRASYGINVTHGLTELTKLTGSVGYSKDELSSGANRQDTRHLVKFGVVHNLLSWIELGANVSYEDRKSTVELAEYQVNSVDITVKVSFD